MEVVWHLNIISIHWEYNQILTSDYDQVHNEVATLTASTSLVIEKTTPHAPSNVTVTRKETFAVTIEWLPGYSGCSHCEQTYKIRWESEIFLNYNNENIFGSSLRRIHRFVSINNSMIAVQAWAQSCNSLAHWG